MEMRKFRFILIFKLNCNKLKWNEMNLKLNLKIRSYFITSISIFVLPTLLHSSSHFFLRRMKTELLIQMDGVKGVKANEQVSTLSSQNNFIFWMFDYRVNYECLNHIYSSDSPVRTALQIILIINFVILRIHISFFLSESNEKIPITIFWSLNFILVCNLNNHFFLLFWYYFFSFMVLCSSFHVLSFSHLHFFTSFLLSYLLFFPISTSSLFYLYPFPSLHLVFSLLFRYLWWQPVIYPGI